VIHAIDVARTQLDVVELTGRNDGIPAERYMRGDKLAWCAGFVLWCYDESDDPDIWDDFNPETVKDARRYWELRAVTTMMQWAHEMGVFVERNVLPAENDVIFYGNRSGSDRGYGKHTGIVEKVDATHIHTIEGNLRDRVRRRRVRIGHKDIAGFARFARYTPDHIAARMRG
jgi:hypothetical protein